jgi:hypothetical protein
MYYCMPCDAIWDSAEQTCWLCGNLGARNDGYGLWLLQHYQEAVDIEGSS